MTQTSYVVPSLGLLPTGFSTSWDPDNKTKTSPLSHQSHLWQVRAETVRQFTSSSSHQNFIIHQVKQNTHMLKDTITIQQIMFEPPMNGVCVCVCP